MLSGVVCLTTNVAGFLVATFTKTHKITDLVVRPCPAPDSCCPCMPTTSVSHVSPCRVIVRIMTGELCVAGAAAVIPTKTSGNCHQLPAPLLTLLPKHCTYTFSTFQSIFDSLFVFLRRFPKRHLTRQSSAVLRVGGVL